MFSFSQRIYGDVGANTGHIILFFMAYMVEKPEASFALLTLVACGSFFGWIYNYKRALAIADIPLSSIGSAAQGYVELAGKTSIDTDSLILSPLSGQRCVWFRYIVYEKIEDDWRKLSENTSPYTIQLKDGTGTCQVDADGAEIIGATQRISYEGNYKHDEHLIYGGNNLYVLGELTTVGGASTPLNLKEDVSHLLAEWKNNKAELIKRFDLNKDGEIDLREWELARREAVRQVQLQHRDIRASSGVNVVRAPHDKKVYIISTISPQKLRSKFIKWMLFHMLIVLIAASYAITLWRQHPMHLS
jgi:hypothetical protein